jgi:predicted glycosyltransferase
MQLADYEHSNKLPSFLSSDWLMIPETIPTGQHWQNPARISTYPGIKEDVYVPNFEPETGILANLGITEEEIVVTIRPPASEAHYHNPKSDDLFYATVNWLSGIDSLRMVVLPRNNSQAAYIGKTWPALISEAKMVIPDRVLDGLNLIWHSDLVISGGGTMNREAAALGVPVYSIFRGEIGAVDKYLSNTGRLTLLETADEIMTKVLIKKWERPISPDHNPRPALKVIVTKVLELLEH